MSTNIEWRNDPALLAQLKHHEGLSLKPYKDTKGLLTIGYGRNLDGKGITQLEAEFMLLHDINEIAEFYDKAIPWWRDLAPKAQRVLIDMGMMGPNKVLGFNNMLGYLRAGHYDMAASEILHSKYAKDVGSRATDLFNQMK